MDIEASSERTICEVEVERRPLHRTIGHAGSRQGRYTRIVDRFSLYRKPLDFRALCASVLRPRTRYLILDLDRTTHRALNLGEQLGWEIAAYRFYGPERMQQLDRARGPLAIDPEAPERLPAFLLGGARTWAFPGLSYLLWGKLTTHVGALERWSYRRYGTEPIRAVQRLPQTALLHEMAGLPHDTLRWLARRVWERAAGSQVIDRADLVFVRERCPNIQIVLTSASPRPMLEVAAEALGLDAIESSSTEAYGDRFAAPYWVDRRFSLGDLERISPPSKVRLNSGHGKIERLLERYPDMLDPDVESVGISDTGYGEDHAWAQYFRVVVDVNSQAPFPPLVAADSPLREVHSASLLTARERATASAGRPPIDVVQLQADQLAAKLAPFRDRVERTAADYRRTASRLARPREALDEELAREHARIERLVAAYNAAQRRARPLALRALRRQLRSEAAVRRKLADLEAPLSRARMEIARELREARAEIGALAAAPVEAQTPIAQPSPLAL